MSERPTWRLILNPEGRASDLPAYAAALVEGRVAGRYMLSRERLPDTVLIQSFREKGILAGAEVAVDYDAAEREGIAVARRPRSGRGAPKPLGTITLPDLLKGASRRFRSVARKPDDPAALLYTAGTTDNPKGVTLTHRNFAAQRTLADRLLPMSPTDRIVLVLPLFHVYGLANGLVCGVHAGGSLVLVPQYSPAKLLDAIVETSATVLIAIPNMYSHLLQLARARRTTSLPTSLRICISGGAPLPINTLRAFEKIFQTRIVEGYGLTETTSAVSLNRSGTAFKPGSIGPASPGIEMRVVDEDGRETAPGEVGEIVIRADAVTPGYWNNPAATAEAIRDGWLYTGDLGTRDEDGFFFVTDRKKDIIIRGGFNVSPREIEEVVLRHQKIQDAAAIGALDRHDRETIKLFVVPEADESPSEKEIIAYCAEHLADYKVPRTVVLCDSLPRSATGKLLRKELREGYSDERLLSREANTCTSPATETVNYSHKPSIPTADRFHDNQTDESTGSGSETAPDILSDMLSDTVRRHKRRTALYFEGREITWRELDEQAARFADGLSGLGIVADDRVAIMLPNIPEFAACFLGIQKLGAIAVPFNTMYKGREIIHILKDSGARALVALSSFASLIDEIRENTPTLEHVILTGERTLVYVSPRSTLNVQIITTADRFTDPEDAFRVVGEILVRTFTEFGVETWYKHRGGVRADGRKIASVLVSQTNNLLLINAICFLGRLFPETMFRVVWAPPEVKDKLLEPLTSIEEHTGCVPSFEAFANAFGQHLSARFDIDLKPGRLKRDELFGYEKATAMANKRGAVRVDR